MSEGASTVDRQMRQIQIPEDLCVQVEQRYSTRFSTAEELVIRILQELVEDSSSLMDEAERQLIERRLQDLGYI